MQPITARPSPRALQRISAASAASPDQRRLGGTTGDYAEGESMGLGRAQLRGGTHREMCADGDGLRRGGAKERQLQFDRGRGAASRSAERVNE